MWNGQKNSVECKQSPVHSSSLIGVASVGDKNPQISLSRGVVLSQSTFLLVVIRGGSRNFHMGRPVKGPSKFWVGQQEWCTWGRISFG